MSAHEVVMSTFSCLIAVDNDDRLVTIAGEVGHVSATLQLLLHNSCDSIPDPTQPALACGDVSSYFH